MATRSALRLASLAVWLGGCVLGPAPIGYVGVDPKARGAVDVQALAGGGAYAIDHSFDDRATRVGGGIAGAVIVDPYVSPRASVPVTLSTQLAVPERSGSVMLRAGGRGRFGWNGRWGGFAGGGISGVAWVDPATFVVDVPLLDGEIGGGFVGERLSFSTGVRLAWPTSAAPIFYGSWEATLLVKLAQRTHLAFDAQVGGQFAAVASYAGAMIGVVVRLGAGDRSGVSRSTRNPRRRFPRRTGPAAWSSTAVHRIGSRPSSAR